MIYILTKKIFSSCLTLRKKPKFIFEIFREWWPRRVCNLYIALFVVFLDALKKVEIYFCEISRMIATAKLPSFLRVFSGLP